MLICEGYIKCDIDEGQEADQFGDKPDVYTDVFVLGYSLTEYYLKLIVADEMYIDCADLYLLRPEGYNEEFLALMKGIHAIHKDGSVSLDGLDDFKYRARCVWGIEYRTYHIRELTPILDTYLEAR